MQWFILLVLVPAVLVPVVLLFGFAGCTPFTAAAEEAAPPASPPAAPSDLNANGTGEHAITLSWQNNQMDATAFVVHRDGGAGATEFTVSSSSPPPDSGLIEGTTYTYKVKALRGGNPADASDWSKSKQATAFPSAPSAVSAVPQEVNKIQLTWTNNSASADQFIIHDHPTTGGGDADTTVPASKGNPQTAPLPVASGSAHEFTVFASVQAFQNVDPLAMPAPAKQQVKSLPSTTVAAKPLVFKAALATDQSGFAGFTIVQRIKAASLSNKGTKVKITLRGPLGTSLTIDHVAISQAATGAAADPWDSAADLTTVQVGVVLAANTRKTLDPANYTLDRTKDLLIAFDINPASDLVRMATLPGAGLEAYTVLIDPPEALTKDRADGSYNIETDNLYLIEEIEVT